MSNEALNCCSRCGKDIGIQWHYDFESIELDSDVGGQCPRCGLILCDADRKFGTDGNFESCPKCGVRMVTLCEGKAYSSMVEEAMRDSRYHDGITHPSILGRAVTIE